MSKTRWLEMEELKINPVELSDLLTLQNISILTFSETFSALNTEKNMREYLEKNLSVEQLKKEIQRTGSFFYLAEIQKQTIGYLKLNFGEAQTEFKDQNFCELERIYVLKEFQGKYIGKRILEIAIVKAKQAKTENLWLGVWEENHKAIEFYQRNGFEIFDKHIFKLGEDNQTDLLMKLKLEA